MKKKKMQFILLFLMVIMLTGCANGAVGVTVHKNGSVDVSMNLQMDASINKLIGKSLDKVLETTMSDFGIQVHKNQSGDKTEYELLKTYASLQEMKEIKGDFKGIKMDVKETDRFFYTKYNISAQLNLTEYEPEMLQSIRSFELPEKLSQFILNQLAFDFSLTLPIDVFGDHNANKIEGNTLIWNISLTDPEPVRVEINAPNIKNICIVVGSALLIVILVVIYFINRRKKHRKYKES
ncbi:hypothetical protein ACP8HI_04040 [Paenibacillus sp. FA6]|uniref:hypothetical protein n=1 Tax=Paenibacillus sp. FA6 TaxID=3413029 RepID=UPI003F654CB5